MDSQILTNAKRDLPLYLKDFNDFWTATQSYISDEDLTNCYAASILFKNWKIALNHIGINEVDSILLELHEDVNAAFYHSFFGHYRSSYTHMRSLIELGLLSIYFIDHKVEFKQWLNSEFRIKHSELIEYLKKHPNLNFIYCKNLLQDISRQWSVFSKHIHGEDPGYFQSLRTSTQTKTITAADFGKWKTSYLKISSYMNKLLIIFFKDDLTRFPSQSRELLLRSLTDDDKVNMGLSV